MQAGNTLETNARAALAEGLAGFGGTVRANIDEADEAGDGDIADIFTNVWRELDKWLWFTEAHQPA